MKNVSPIDDYIQGHPKEVLQLIIIISALLWQSSLVVVGLPLYLLFARLLKIKAWILLSFGIVGCMETLWYLQTNPQDFLKEGFSYNLSVWKQFMAGDVWFALCLIYYHGLPYILGGVLLFVGLLALIDLVPESPHAKVLKGLGQGKHSEIRHELPDHLVKKRLNDIQEEAVEGTLLGVSTYTGKPLVISDSDINQILLVLGTTGGGKTITLRRFYQRAIRQGYPLIIVDGKPSPNNIEWVMKLAEQYRRPFFGFNCGNFYQYDCLDQGGFTELKDKIISLKDQWENDYYKSIAEDYLQTTFEVLLQVKEPFDLKRVVECLDYDELALTARFTEDENLMKRVVSLEQYDRKDITGLQAHLNLLIHSELGKYFESNGKVFSLSKAIQQNGVVYFALPALRFPNFSKILGKLVINDLKAVIDRLNNSKPLFTVFDEFSVFAGDQALNLVNMGREKGVHAIFGTQGLADLSKVTPQFLDQMLNCANTLICHRLNDQESAERISQWVGTKDAFTVTAQVSLNQGATGLGTVKSNKEFIIHPDLIKQSLQTGEAFYITKVGKFSWNKVKVKI